MEASKLQEQTNGATYQSSSPIALKHRAGEMAKQDRPSFQRLGAPCLDDSTALERLVLN